MSDCLSCFRFLIRFFNIYYGGTFETFIGLLVPEIIKWIKL